MTKEVLAVCSQDAWCTWLKSKPLEAKFVQTITSAFALPKASHASQDLSSAQCVKTCQDDDTLVTAREMDSTCLRLSGCTLPCKHTAFIPCSRRLLCTTCFGTRIHDKTGKVLTVSDCVCSVACAGADHALELVKPCTSARDW